MTLDDILLEIHKAKTIVILAHEGPDGDAIGSSMAMKHLIDGLGEKRVDVLMKEFPANFKYLPGVEEIKTETDIDKYDLAICLDCPDLNRVCEEFRKYFENAEFKIEFDHHNKNAMFGDLNIVDHVSPACSQILLQTFEYWNLELTKDILTCLITGIITDTNGFRNSNILPETFEYAGMILRKGIDIPKIYNQAMLTKTMNRFNIEKVAQDRIEFFEDGKIAFTYITLEDAQKLNLAPGDHDGIVEIARSIEGVEVSIFLYEKEVGFKASLRSVEYVNVAEVCSTFGGGGHIRAAGATLTHDLEESKNLIISETIKAIRNRKNK